MPLATLYESNIKYQNNAPYFAYEEAHIRTLFFILVVNNITFEQGNKLQNRCNVLTEVAKYKKVRK